MIYAIAGLLIALIGVANLTTARLHPERPNATLSKGLGYIGIVIGALTFVFGLGAATGIIVPPPMPQAPAAPATVAPKPAA